VKKKMQKKECEKKTGFHFLLLGKPILFTTAKELYPNHSHCRLKILALMKKKFTASFFVQTKKSGISLEFFLIESREVESAARNNHSLSSTPVKLKK